MSKTVAEIAVSVLLEIGRAEDGKTPPESQTKQVEDSYDGLYEELFNDSLVNWASDDDIPEFATDPIIILLAGRVCGRFGVPDEWSVRETQQRLKLGSQIATPYEPQPTQFTDY